MGNWFSYACQEAPQKKSKDVQELIDDLRGYESSLESDLLGCISTGDGVDNKVAPIDVRCELIQKLRNVRNALDRLERSPTDTAAICYAYTTRCMIERSD